MISTLSLRLLGPPPRLERYASVARVYAFADVPWDPADASIFAGASPAVVDGNIGEVSATSPGGYLTTLNPDGTVIIDSGGDPSRQTFKADVYTIALMDWGGEVTDYDGNLAPVPIDPDGQIVFFFNLNVPITPIDLGPLGVDPEGDALDVQAQAPWATGLSEALNILSGTPTVRGIIDTRTRWTDIAGDYFEATVRQVIGLITVPDEYGELYSAAVTDLIAQYFIVVTGDTIYLNDQAPAGTVISQSPAAFTDAAPGAEVILTVSLGPLPPPLGGTPRRKRIANTYD